MPFCSKCGAEIIEGAKFCQECGAPISAQAEQYLGKRQQEYSGKIYKCPNCGEILNSFEAVCPACGYELRGSDAAHSVQQLAKELASIEASRPQKAKSSSKSTSNDVDIADETDMRIANIIQNFPIPNTKEDILEFIILASSNVNINALDKDWSRDDYSIISVAWAAKLEQAYQKAKTTFGDNPDFKQIEEIYRQKSKAIKKGRTKSTRTLSIYFGSIFAFFVIFIFIVLPIRKANDQARLDRLIKEIESALDNNEYQLAMMTALSIEYEGSDKEQERKWPIQRTYWIEKILEEAAAHGVDLEYMIPVETEPPQESEPPKETSPQGFFSGFIQGFQNALNPSPSPSN